MDVIDILISLLTIYDFSLKWHNLIYVYNINFLEKLPYLNLNFRYIVIDSFRKTEEV